MTNEELALRIAIITDCSTAQRIVVLHLLNENQPERALEHAESAMDDEPKKKWHKAGCHCTC